MSSSLFETASRTFDGYTDAGTGLGVLRLDPRLPADYEALREGWNERVLCKLPESTEDGQDNGPDHHPWVLPDQSGVIVAAGWPGRIGGFTWWNGPKR
jgi:hypothetical protein